MGHIVSIVNNKGGVGKTTTTVNLGVALAKKKKKVLVIDMDSQSNSTEKLLLGKPPSNGSLYDVFQGGEISQDVLYTTKMGLTLLPNTNDSATLEPSLTDRRPDSYFEVRDKIKEYAADRFDYTLIDCPPNMGTFVVMALMSSDFVIVPVDAASSDSVSGLLKAVNVIEEMGGSQNKNLRFLRVLINFMDQRTRIAKEIAVKIREAFPSEMVFETEIPVNTTFAQAESQNSSIFEYDQASRGARAFRALAKEFIGILEAK